MKTMQHEKSATQIVIGEKSATRKKREINMKKVYTNCERRKK